MRCIIKNNPKNLLIYFFFECICMVSGFAQETGIVKTTTYNKSSDYKVISSYSKEMILKREEYYYTPSNNIYAAIDYYKSGKISKFTGYDKKRVIFFLDYLNGKYTDIVNETLLNFRGEFIFEGIQKCRNVICNYKNGKREGYYVQIDSAVSGKKLISVKRPNIYLLQKNIIAYYDNIEETNTYKKFEPIKLNFKNDQLNGIQRGNYPLGDTRFIAEYLNGRLVKYNSFETDRSIITKLNSTNGISSERYILNGQIVNDLSLKLFYVQDFLNAGRILKHNSIQNANEFSTYVDEDDIPERDDLEPINISYIGNEEKGLLHNLMESLKIPVYHIKPIKIPTLGDYKIYLERIKKYKIGENNLCNELYILENNARFKEVGSSVEFEKNILNSYYDDSSAFKINIYPKYDEEKTQQIITFLNIAKSLHSSNYTKEISFSEDFKYLYDSTKVYTTQALNHKFASTFLDINNFYPICFKRDSLKFVIERPNQFYVEDMFGQKTIFEYSLIQYPYIKINVKISQIKVVDSSLIFEITKQVEF